MTATPKWFSQPVPPLGAITSEGIKNPLGRPALDRLTVLVREAAQNSWDARATEPQPPVRFELDLRSHRTTDGWRALLESAPEEHLPLRDVLSQDSFDVLYVSDRGTKGLGGSTRGGADPGERKDYLSFVLNVGVPSDRELGGGTFGFGKAILYNCSLAQTVLVHTRTSAGEGWKAESRFIGIGLGASHVEAGREYTGRYWWGHVEPDVHVEPLRGADADDMARSLGFPPFEDSETGTTIAIVGLVLDERTREEASDIISKSVTWHLWPKMAAKEMEIAVRLDGEDVPVSGPEDHPVIAHFTSVLHDLDAAKPVLYAGEEIGRLRIATSFAPKPPIDEVGRQAGLDRGVHHVCLMRAANLVVEYVPGEPLPDEHLWYAGVFRSSTGVDEAFAAAEPPTHDTWEPSQLEPQQRKTVKYALRKVKEALRAHATPEITRTTQQETGGSLGALSSVLGSLLAPATGGGASSSTSSSADSRRRVVRMDGPARWEHLLGRQVLVQDFEYDGSRVATVEASLRVLVWGGGGETDPPAGSARPTLLQWIRPDGVVIDSERLQLRKGDAGRWRAVIVPVDETVTGIQIREARRDAT